MSVRARDAAAQSAHAEAIAMRLRRSLAGQRESTRPMSKRKYPQQPFVIYALVDPRDMVPRYVGCTQFPIARFSAHISQPMAHLAEWLGALTALGLKPIFQRLQTLSPKDDWDFSHLEAEQRWIARARRLGFPILNKHMVPFRADTSRGRWPEIKQCKG